MTHVLGQLGSGGHLPLLFFFLGVGLVSTALLRLPSLGTLLAGAGSEGVPIQDAGIADGSLAYCNTVPVPAHVFLKS